MKELASDLSYYFYLGSDGSLKVSASFVTWGTANGFSGAVPARPTEFLLFLNEKGDLKVLCRGSPVALSRICWRECLVYKTCGFFGGSTLMLAISPHLLRLLFLK